jgi:ThiF family
VSPDPDEESVFRYIDTATIRARIALISRKLEQHKVAIIGLGGTGSYILDLVAKTPVREIHLYDPDVFHQHNAFRAPGAPSMGQLQEKLAKVDHFASIYGNMRTGIVPHREGLTSDNVGELTGMSFVFIAMDAGKAKRLAIDKLIEASVPFVDCGIGVYTVEQALAGVVRVTTGTSSKHDHILQQVPFTDGEVNNEYAQNIQIADLNALNAALAVIRWKKLCTFYGDLEREHSSAYSIDGNCIANGDNA